MKSESQTALQPLKAVVLTKFLLLHTVCMATAGGVPLSPEVREEVEQVMEAVKSDTTQIKVFLGSGVAQRIGDLMAEAVINAGFNTKGLAQQAFRVFDGSEACPGLMQLILWTALADDTLLNQIVVEAYNLTQARVSPDKQVAWCKTKATTVAIFNSIPESRAQAEVENMFHHVNWDLVEEVIACSPPT
jgi:hypothetical protein